MFHLQAYRWQCYTAHDSVSTLSKERLTKLRNLWIFPSHTTIYLSLILMACQTVHTLCVVLWFLCFCTRAAWYCSNQLVTLHVSEQYSPTAVWELTCEFHYVLKYAHFLFLLSISIKEIKFIYYLIKEIKFCERNSVSHVLRAWRIYELNNLSSSS